MRCEDARVDLPAYSAGELVGPGVGELEVHLATCAGCSTELERYRELAHSVQALRDELEAPSAALKVRVLTGLPARRSVGADLRHLAETHPRARVAAVSLGGVALGAAAIAMLWWRAARRSIQVEAARPVEVLAE